jgi:hypothetical protein
MIYNIPHLEEVPLLAKAIAAKFGALPQVSCPYLRHLNSLIDALDQVLLREGLITESGKLVHFRG